MGSTAREQSLRGFVTMIASPLCQLALSLDFPWSLLRIMIETVARDFVEKPSVSLACIFHNLPPQFPGILFDSIIRPCSYGLMRDQSYQACHAMFNPCHTCTRAGLTGPSDECRVRSLTGRGQRISSTNARFNHD